VRILPRMRGGLEQWKRGVDSRGVRNAIAYAMEGTCDGHLVGAAAAEAYGDLGHASVTRFIAENGGLRTDKLTAGGLRVWVTGHDPVTGEERGRQRLSADADLLLDGTINAPKSFSVAAMLHPGLAREFEALQDRLRDRIILTWQTELNARRGHGGLIREEVARLEVVELQHRRSRALDPHIHRHLWLNIKVQGADRKWSNLDSRVAMRVQTLINAEGELAARTDPTWIAALARHGLSLDADGEIAQLAAVVRPLSRRSVQIETNRAALVAQWRSANPDAEPSHDILAQIDRRAWAHSRPDKPQNLDEDEWESRVRDELAAIDPSLGTPRQPIAFPVPAITEVDVDTLAVRAVSDADARSTGSAGRYSLLDLRAGAVRAVAHYGVVAPREELGSLVEEVTERARAMSVSLLTDEGVPAHVKALMADVTVKAKLRLSSQLDALAVPGTPIDTRQVEVAGDVLGAPLDPEQVMAAAAVAGSDELVAVTGPAGAGKTTMLRVARALLIAQRRRMLVIAPTKKAAAVAGRETAADAASIHALLYDHGYRWARQQPRRMVPTPAGRDRPGNRRHLLQPLIFRVAARRSSCHRRGRDGRTAHRERSRRTGPRVSGRPGVGRRSATGAAGRALRCHGRHDPPRYRPGRARHHSPVLRCNLRRPLPEAPRHARSARRDQRGSRAGRSRQRPHRRINGGST
jgi:exodeoxyribonuclease V alpha subunit